MNIHKGIRLVTAIALLGGLLFAGCGLPIGATMGRIFPSGVIVSQAREVSAFSAIKVESAIRLIYTQGEATAIQLSASDNVIDRIATEVIGNTLYIRVRKGTSLSAFDDITAEVTAPQLEALTLSGASQMLAQTPLQAGVFELQLSGASTAEFELNCAEVTVLASGASQVKLKGAADDMRLDLSGASRADLRSFTTVNAQIHASGASYADVWVSDELFAEASGASNILYDGQGIVKKAEESGASSIRSAR